MQPELGKAMVFAQGSEGDDSSVRVGWPPAFVAPDAPDVPQTKEASPRPSVLILEAMPKMSDAKPERH